MPIAFVIGGARRLGRSISLRLASEGYDVGISYFSSEQHARTLATEVLELDRRFASVRCDVRDEDELHATWRALCQALGQPDVVVLCAGVFPDPQQPETLTSEHLINVMRVNSLPLLSIAANYALDCRASQTTGRLISIGSLGATEIWKDRLLYNTSKGAARTIALSLARSMAPTLSVNIVAPGAISQPNDSSTTDQYLIAPERIPMLRHGTDVDVCDAVMFFAQASHYITGQTISVDGGYGLTR